MLSLVDDLSVRRLPGAKDQPPRCQLIVDGQETGSELPGAVFEAAADTNDGWLIFLTDDVPFEESLNICLIDRAFRIRDRVTLVWPGSSGTFRDPCPTGDNSLQFEFFGDRPWFVDLFKSPRFRLPLFSEPIGVFRPFGFTRRFQVRRG